jgi:hypothetical protein
MADHEPLIPLSIEAVVSRLQELEIVLGSEVRPSLERVRAALLQALAARDRGDQPETVRQVGLAMDELAALADRLDPAEAALMRAATETFRRALLQGDAAGARRTADVMFERSGAAWKKKE